MGINLGNIVYYGSLIIVWICLIKFITGDIDKGE